MLEFVPVTEGHIARIAADMRPADVEEVWASNHHTPLEALAKGWAVSDFSAVVTHDGVPLVMLGVVKGDILTGSGVVWLLGTNEALKHRRIFLEQTRGVLDELLSICPRLHNYVHTENKTSVRWLKHIGFTIEDAVPYGPDGEMFHPFHLERI